MSYHTGKLTVFINRAQLTRDLCTFGSMDPSCTIKLSHAKVFNSSIKTNEGKYPIWNEIASFQVENENSLRVEVYHQKDMVCFYHK
jgi:Ca2+-dependent lipid-binding protein